MDVRNTNKHEQKSRVLRDLLITLGNHYDIQGRINVEIKLIFESPRHSSKKIA